MSENAIGDAIEGLLRKVSAGKETVFDIKEVDGVRRVEFIHRNALDELRSEPLPLDRPDKRSHVFHDHVAFAKYVQREAQSQSAVVLADANSEKIVAVLHESIDKQPELISMRATIHPLFKPWLDILEKPVPVLEFGLFCARNRRSIVKPNGREVALIFQQIKIAKVVEIQRGVGVKALNGITIQTEISGQTTSELVQIPETIEISCPIYIGGEKIVVPIDILVTERGDSVVVYATCPLLAALRSEAFESFVASVQQILGPEFLVGLGCVDHTPWNVIEQPS